MPATPRRSTGSTDAAASPQLSTRRMRACGSFRVNRPPLVHSLFHAETASFSTGCDSHRGVETRAPSAKSSAHRAVFAQARVEFRPGVIVPTMRTLRLHDRVRYELETVPVGFDAGRKFLTGDRAFDQQGPHTSPIPPGSNIQAANPLGADYRRHEGPIKARALHKSACCIREPPGSRRRAGRSPRSSRPGSQFPCRRCRRRCRARPTRTGSGCRWRTRPTG